MIQGVNALGWTIPPLQLPRTICNIFDADNPLLGLLRTESRRDADLDATILELAEPDYPLRVTLHLHIGGFSCRWVAMPSPSHFRLLVGTGGLRGCLSLGLRLRVCLGAAMPKREDRSL